MDLKSLILGKGQHVREPVPTPEWPEADGKVFVRVLSAAEKIEFDISLDEGNIGNYYARLAVRAACDSDGQRIFTDGDAGALGKEPAPPVQRIAEAARRLNGMTPEAKEGLEKNSETTRACGSGSGSPATAATTG